MSRSTVSKSRADKAKDKDNKSSTSAPAPPVNTDVIPGRFTENDWNVVFDKEDGEDFIVDVVADIVDSAINVIYDNYIQKQLYPYVVDKSRELFLHIIEWQFLARDEGESNPVEDETWAEEDEPSSSVPDAWAQGSVPHQALPSVSPTMSEHDTEVTSVSRISNPEILEDLPSTFNDTGTLEEEEAEPTETERSHEKTIEEEEVEDEKENNNNQENVEETKTPVKPRKPKYKPYRGPIRSAGVRSINKPLDETEKELIEAEMMAKGGVSPVKKSALDYMPSSCHNILKVQTGRPPGSKEVTYDDMGNVVAVVKLDPEKLPSHRIRTKFTVIDPAVEAAQARLQAMRTGRHHQAADNVVKRTRGRSTQQGTAARTVRTNATSVAASVSTSWKTKEEDDGITPLPPPLIESMELSAGVTVREGSRFKQGPKLTLRQTEVTSGKIRSLRPLVKVDNQGVPLSVGDIIGAQSPSVRPLTLNDPIPPILPRHNSSRENMVES